MSDPRERIIEETLSALALKRGCDLRPGAAINPREALMDAEERADTLDENRLRVEAANRLLDFVFQDGPNPERAMKWLFALVRRTRSELLCGLTMNEQAKMFGETRAAVSWRVKQLGKFQRSRGSRAYISRAEKRAGASESYRRREKTKVRPAA